MALPARCPQCGTDARSEAGIEGLCPQCLFSLALLESPSPVYSADAPTQYVESPGRLLGDRYQIRELLGRGGMGEVYRAFDLKLRVDVALKTVRPAQAWDERARDLLRQEVRAAREVVSPNVCRIFDLVDQEGQELLSMEYIDGATLAETLRTRGPLPLSDAREIASQFLAGLEAIHAAGLVHRDFKPENIMVTRAGRVVVMDFGVARAARDGPSLTIAGTPAYMAPEQARGGDVERRADLFSAGVVLAEMISVGGRDSMAAREALWTAVRRTPPRVPDSPWSAVLERAVAPAPSDRFASANALARALEEVTLRVPGIDERRPYPGLASFTEQDAEFFFGREVEVEGVWKKLKRPRLLGVIGPSGAGKSSFLRAGLLPTLPPSWRAMLATPGTHPFQALAQALVPQCAEDTEALQALVRFDDADAVVGAVSRWRGRHEHTLVIIDQFEELFTQNPAGVQAAFAALLGRLVLDADTHVILSFRDDFLIGCHAQEALAPMLSDLTLLGPLGASALRRALVQPALSCGYKFEDEALVEEMVQEVVSERGALPLLAFAASRLWDARDRDRGVLTRAAYEESGGVAGALAQHAEAALDRIGPDRVPLVRELFRNLVTSQGTRAVRRREELLSVFRRHAGDAGVQGAESVLNTLVDARLLTTYERTGDADERVQEIEIIHESLLTTWPRLVRWQTQDADGAQLRDQLRQAAQLWHERGRPEDLLWSGVAYRDFALWHERYRGGLSATEEAFATAAARRADRRRRRRQLAASALVAGVTLVAMAMLVLWRQSEAARREATAESLRAEAGKLQVLGERDLLTYPTASLAYAIKSLELADTPSARLLALRVLQQAPVARIARTYADAGRSDEASGIDFSPTSEWVAWGGRDLVELVHRDGGRRMTFEFDKQPVRGGRIEPRFAPGGQILVGNRGGEVRVWSVPDRRELHRGHVDNGTSIVRMGTDAFYTLTQTGDQRTLHAWPLASPTPRAIGHLDARPPVALNGRALAYADGRGVYVRTFDGWDRGPRLIFSPPPGVSALALSEDGSEVAVSDDTTIRVASTETGARGEGRVVATTDEGLDLRYDPSGRWLSSLRFDGGHPTFRVFERTAPPGAEPVVLRKGDTSIGSMYAFDAEGRWLASAHGREAAFWPLDAPHVRILRPQAPAQTVVFAPDGRRVLYQMADRSVRTWPLDRAEAPRVIFQPGPGWPIGYAMAMDRSGRLAAVTGLAGRVVLLRTDSERPTVLAGFPERSFVSRPAFSPDGRLLAAAMHGSTRDQKVIRVWDLEGGTSRAYGPLPGAGDLVAGGIVDVAFAGPDHLVAAVHGTGLISLDLSSGVTRVLVPGAVAQFVLASDGHTAVALTRDEHESEQGPRQALRLDLDRGTSEVLPHGATVGAIALDPTGTVVATGNPDGTIRVSRVGTGATHLLLGQQGAIYSLAFSPDGRWLAASGEAEAIRLWPVPDVSKTPMHLLPLDTLVATLRSHTNLRAVRNDAADTGYVLEPGPFPGWSTPPAWK